MIPAEAIEAAAKCDYERELGVDWDGLRPSVKRGYLDDAQAALEAAAPHMQRGDGELWREFQAATATAGTNPSETIRQLVREWVDTRKETT